MPKTRSIETFTFDELSDEGTPGRPYKDGYMVSSPSPKERARDWYREGWSDLITEQVSETFATELSLRGLYLETAWEFYVQGGGVAFSGTIDLSGIKPVEQDGDHRPDQDSDEKHITIIKACLEQDNWSISPDDLGVQVSHSHQHTSPSGMDVEVTCYAETEEGDPLLSDEQIEELADTIREWLVDLAHEFHKIGMSEIEYMESDEQISESCEANEYLFDKYGKPIHHLIEGETA